MRVAIIGAGPSGVAAFKSLRSEQGQFSHIKLFERTSNVGGAWNYSPSKEDHHLSPATMIAHARSKGTDLAYLDHLEAVTQDQGARRSWPSPMYAKLNTNTPRDLMVFSDFMFPSGTGMFPSREEVLQYLEAYSVEALEHVQFRSEVTSVRKHAQSASWSVTAQSIVQDDGTVETMVEEFDRVVIATGHYEVPRIPDIPGLSTYEESYPGRIQHAKYYCTSTHYQNKKTLIVGSGPSGQDIALQISCVAQTPVLWSSRLVLSSDLHQTGKLPIQSMPGIHRFHKDGTIELADGTMIQGIERVLFCTGYLYSFPFLQLDGKQPLTDGEMLYNLHELMLYIPDPTIAFIAMGQSELICGVNEFFTHKIVEIVPFPQVGT